MHFLFIIVEFHELTVFNNAQLEINKHISVVAFSNGEIEMQSVL